MWLFLDAPVVCAKGGGWELVAGGEAYDDTITNFRMKTTKVQTLGVGARTTVVY